MQRDQIDLGTVKVSRLFRLYFFPTLMGMLSLCAVTAIDGIFVGHSTGSDGLAAVNICIAPTMVIVGIGLMFGVGASVVCSIHLARQRLKAARINATQALLAGVIAVLLFLALTLSAPRSTARILGCSDTLMPLVLDYMPWIFLCCLFQIFGAIGLFIVRLDGAPRYAMWCNLIPALLNIVLDYVFMFPLGMGLMGAGIATLISCAVGGTMALVYLIGYAGQLRLIRFKLSARSLHLTIRNLGYQCRIGISALLGEATMGMLMFMGNIVFMSYLGDDGVGAFSIACYYCPFVFMIGNAIAQSVQPIISYNYGQGKHHRVVQAERLAVICAGLCRLSRPNDCAISRRRFRCSGHCSEWISAICCCLCVFCFQSDGYRLLSGCRESVGRYSVCTVARIGFYGSEFPATPRNYRDERYLAGFRIERGVDFGMHPRLLSSRKA